MIEDLIGTDNTTAQADVLIIGAGTVGLVMASSLARQGLSVLCLESGGWSQSTDEHPLNEVIHTRSVYAGAALGRYRCIGGTSTRWGGAMLPFLARDVADAGWPIRYEEIIAYRKAVEDLFGLSDGPYEFPDILEPDNAAFVPRMAKWPRFGLRNVFHLLETDLRGPRGPRIVLNATATDFHVSGRRLQRVTARAPDGSSIVAEAGHIVLAAGAIETTRLLLLLQRQNPGSFHDDEDLLGRDFHDHLSVRIGTLDPIDRPACNRLFGFRFEANGSMRNLRFELSETTPLRGTIPRCFAHVGFTENPESGFHALRELLRYAQQRRLPPPSTLAKLALSSPWLLRAAWWRWYERRLLYPSDAELEVHMVIEQTPQPRNRVSLASRTDSFGQPLAQIEWSVGSEDVHNVLGATDAFVRMWNSSNLASVARLLRRPPAEIERDLVGGGGIYHPGGSTRMGASPKSGVVDRDLRVFGIDNVSAVSTAVLPTGGGANPTMMLLMLGLRCVDRLRNELQRAGSQRDQNGARRENS